MAKQSRNNMLTNWIRVPFDINLAKKIHSNEIEGRIVTHSGIVLRILCFDRKGYRFPPIMALGLIDDGNEYVFDFSPESAEESGIYIELPETQSKQRRGRLRNTLILGNGETIARKDEIVFIEDDPDINGYYRFKTKDGISVTVQDDTFEFIDDSSEEVKTGNITFLKHKTPEQ